MSSNPVFARLWPLLAPRVMTDDERRALLAGLSGSVVEVGAGDGRNFAHYPRSVTRLLALEPERRLRGRARRAAGRAAVPISVVDAAGEGIPADDGTVDAAVCCLVLCSVGDQAAVLAELRRVLRPHGEIRVHEHVVSRGAGLRRVQQVLDRSGIWPRIAAGCHLSRDTATAITDAGFVLEERPASGSGAARRAVPHLVGVARRAGP